MNILGLYGGFEWDANKSFLNDDRAKIKLEINNHTGSVIKEIKEYTSY